MATSSARPPRGGKKAIPYASMFKPMLEQFCKGKGLPPPLYRVVNVGSEEVPSFNGYVLVESVEYTSDGIKPSQEAAEHSAAKQAMLQLNKEDVMHFNIGHLVHNRGLTKNMLEEFAQRLGIPMPAYTTTKYIVEWGLSYFVTTIELGELQYRGPGMPTKKEAEHNAATFACAQLMYALPNLNATIVPQPSAPSK